MLSIFCPEKLNLKTPTSKYCHYVLKQLEENVTKYCCALRCHENKIPRNPRIFAGAQECINSRGSYRAIHNIPPLCPIHSLHFAVCCRGRAASCKNVVKHAQVLWWNSTVWGGRLCKRFCNMFSGSSPCLLWQHGSYRSAQLPGELSENMLQNLLHKLPPQTLCVSMISFGWVRLDCSACKNDTLHIL